MSDDLDLSEMSPAETERHVGHLVRRALGEVGVGLLVLRTTDDSLRMLDAAEVLGLADPEELAAALNRAGVPEDSIVDILVMLDREEEG